MVKQEPSGNVEAIAPKAADVMAMCITAESLFSPVCPLRVRDEKHRWRDCWQEVFSLVISSFLMVGAQGLEPWTR